MKSELKQLDVYLSRLHRDFGWDIFLYDFEGIFEQGGPLAKELASAWHNNPYCVTVKHNPAVHRRCVKYRNRFLRSVRQAKEPFTHTCFCAVAERVIPVRRFGRTVAALSVGGFFGSCTAAYETVLAHRSGMSESGFLALRKRNLTALDKETVHQIDAYLGLAAELIGNLAEPEGNTDRESDRYVRKAREFIELHFSEPITTSDVAAACHVSVSYLQHLFLAKEGRGIYNEIGEHRLRLAKRLLNDTDRSVRQIALSCGYADPDYFSAAFKKRCGVSPLRYRQKSKKE